MPAQAGCLLEAIVTHRFTARNAAGWGNQDFKRQAGAG